MLQQYNPKNENILVYINGRLYPRQEARVSVFDSVVQGGDAVWEGLRVYNGRIFCLDRHLERLQESAHALMFQGVPDSDAIAEAIFTTLKANNMRDGVHIRLTLTRGEKITSGMDPRLNQSGCTLIVLAEWKPPVYPPEITLITSSVRRNNPAFLDSKIHHNNLLNNILAKIEANLAGADAGIMLDKDGFVAETNDVNLFCIRQGHVYTPHADACLPGITRSLVIDICRQHGIPVLEKNLSLTEFYTADEVFTTGTMGELTKVREIDGRAILNKSGDSVLDKIKGHFRALTETGGVVAPG
ncbi:MAG: aminotransferase class IV [Phaeodactylibacter sp.]|nr:aminotransferase class IV [Phaeodactylibacter sp.]MCB9299394.1 aminotransferase class IV [Lewinellaceae bacterium]HQU58064.1 aminotransferase class IV [Saprospiraceae bacterium]